MSTEAAIRFIEAVVADAALRERVRRRGYGVELEELAKLAAEAGYTFTATELRRAFAVDWHMRRRFFAAAEVTARISKPGSGKGA